MGTNAGITSTRITVKTSSSHALVDVSTGEVTPIVEVQGKFVFPGGFAFVGMSYITKLAELKLPADAYRLALHLMKETGYVGIYTKPFKTLADFLGVDPPRISRLLSILEKATVVQRLGNHKGGTIMLNPVFCFRGSVKEQHRAIELWNENRPYNLSKPEPKA